MSARRTLAWTLPGAPEEILRRLQDPEMARRRAQAEPALEAEVTHLEADTPDGEILVMEATATVPRGWVPDRVAHAMPGLPRIVRREAWRLQADGSALVELTVRPDGIPMTTMTGRGSLRPDGDAASTLSYELSLDVAIPLVGRAIERAVLDQICRGYDKEAAVIREL